MAARPQQSESPQEFRQKLELPYNRMGWAFQERPDLDSSASFVLLALAFKAREGGTSTLAVETVCRLTRLGRATVQRALKRLVLAGLITPTGKSPGHWTNKYRLALAPYNLKMPTPAERGPTPKRFPRTSKQAAQRVRSGPVLPSRSETVLPSRSETRETRRVRKAKKDSPPPSIQTSEPPPGSADAPNGATAPPAPANGATAPSGPSNGHNINGEGKGWRVSPLPSDGPDCTYAEEVEKLEAEGRATLPKREAREQPPISREAASLDSYLRGGTGRPLSESWMRYPDLGRQIDRLGFIEVGSVLSELARQTGGHLPGPEEFFGAYGQYRQIHLARSRPRKGRRRAA